MQSFSMFGLGRGLSLFRHLRQQAQQQARQQSTVAASAADAGAASSASKGGLMSNPVIKAGLISGSLSLAGDLLAQVLTNFDKKDEGTYDAARALRMGSFGLLFYGPYQHYWYSALDKALPVRSVTNFGTKVLLNQLCLAPIVICGVFAWTLGCQGRISEWKAKTKQDFVPTLFTGWKFWVPASSINFTMVPLQHQVLYMSACGVLWTAYLSYSSAHPAAVPEPAKGKKDKKKK